MLEKKAFLGSAYYSLNESEVRYIHNGLICIDSNGVIEDVIEQNDENFEEAKQSYKNAGTLKELTEDQILIPGFVDLHIHAPQWPQSGTA